MITGGSGGIGSACARAFASEGARVLVHYHRGEERARALAEELGGAPIAQADLTVEDDVAASSTRRARRSARWTSASRCRASGRETTSRSGSFRSSVGRRRCARTSRRPSSSPAGSCARSSGPGTARSSSSARPLACSARRAMPTTPPRSRRSSAGFCSRSRTRSCGSRREARVNAVAPGWTESPMTRGLVDPEQVAAVSRTMALRKIAQPDDVAAQVVVLASDTLSGHVTGQVVVVAGGMEGRTIHPRLKELSMTDPDAWPHRRQCTHDPVSPVRPRRAGPARDELAPAQLRPRDRHGTYLMRMAARRRDDRARPSG